ncbi:LacI family DNA-binding transcriptional regulator [Salegentibacter sp. F188]|uniref:LacI family DNA-binding transcriptional regulator n=1 Tax=Autumnicola patrickiae TaxID=3075591 RepID=A0ABU3DYK5_9FLAO|nr:LacI family DNA-binding transcriptional regulator [Salegentibacter sp. F188]MDT0688787.1 LacI family DNA-binding transcriptional regulator [Salegentibacter sp. F188]
MREKITLKALSELLGLSPATISKSLSNSSEISSETKERVKKVAAFYNYVPNHYTPKPKIKKRKTIGVIIPTMQISFFSQALESMINEANKNDFRIVACISDESVKKERENIDFLIQRQVDGVVISPAYETQVSANITHLNKLKQLKLPMVLFGRTIDNITCDKIDIDDFGETYKATQELFMSGRKRILYISGSTETGSNEQRKNGYISAVLNLNGKSSCLEYRNTKVFLEDFKLSLKSNEIDGILISDELTAIQLIKNLQKWKYNLPKDISITGFSTGLIEENYFPSFIAIDQKPAEQGVLAIKTLINRIENEIDCDVASCKLQTSLLHEESTV